VSPAAAGSTTGYFAGKPSAYRSPKGESPKRVNFKLKGLALKRLSTASQLIFTLFGDLRTLVQLHRYG
jgi:hypothetical protein